MGLEDQAWRSLEDQEAQPCHDGCLRIAMMERESGLGVLESQKVLLLNSSSLIPGRSFAMFLSGVQDYFFKLVDQGSSCPFASDILG